MVVLGGCAIPRRRVVRKERGVFEKVPGSEIWWIRYKVNGVEHREKVGRFGDAVDLYRIRRADALRGAKMPAKMKNKGVKFEAIGLHALDWYIEHGRKDVRNFRIRMNIILKDFGGRVADEIKPSEIDALLKQHAWSPATKNRYKNVFGRTFKIAFADGRVSGNPARLVEQRPEKTPVFASSRMTKKCPLGTLSLSDALIIWKSSISLFIQGCAKASNTAWSGPRSHSRGSAFNSKKLKMAAIGRFQ